MRPAAYSLWINWSIWFRFLSISFREPGVWALERAKQNVLENYLLVGILEELEDVLLLLERLLPHYFSGVLNIYKTPGGCPGWISWGWSSLIYVCFLFLDYKKMGNLTGTVRKHTPSLEALQVLYHRMRYEYEFYNFIRDQFHLMKKKIGLRSASEPTAYSPAFLRELALRTPEPLDEDEELDGDLEDANSWLVQPWGAQLVSLKSNDWWDSEGKVLTFEVLQGGREVWILTLTFDWASCSACRETPVAAELRAVRGPSNWKDAICYLKIDKDNRKYY